MDVWTEVKDENEVQKKDRVARDSADRANGRAGVVAANDVASGRGRGGRGGRGRLDRNNGNDDPPALVKAIVSPLKVDISAITMEYGLYNQRFWLPRTQALEGEAQVMFIRVPVTVEQKFSYASVNALTVPLPIPPRTVSRVAVLRDSLDSAKTNRTLRDSLVREAVRVRGKEIAAQRERDCAATGMYNTIQRRYEGTLSVAMRVPCDSAKLANSPDLPPSIYDKGDEVFGSGERDALLKALSFALQPAWGPQLPTVEWGLSKTRYNRVEGMSTGLSLSSALGSGYTATLDARGSWADRQLNGAFSLSRTNGRSTIQGTVYRRLDVMTDFGTPLSFGASLASLLYGRDEGAYFRTWGAELGGTTPRWGTLEWRLFAEQQWKADVNSRWTLFGGGNDSRFIANPAAQQAKEFGGALRLHSSVGLDPNGFRLLSEVRLEGAGGDFSYVRGLVDETVSHSTRRSRRRPDRQRRLLGRHAPGAAAVLPRRPANRPWPDGAHRGRRRVLADPRRARHQQPRLADHRLRGSRLGGTTQPVADARASAVGRRRGLVAARRTSAVRPRPRALSVAAVAVRQLSRGEVLS